MNMRYDLEERTTAFAKKIIDFAYTIPITPVTKSIIDQLVRAGTSIGANYREANEGSSRKDFLNKIRISKKETNETLHWLGLVAHAVVEKHGQSMVLWAEAHEFLLIFGKIIRSTTEGMTNS